MHTTLSERSGVQDMEDGSEGASEQQSNDSQDTDRQNGPERRIQDKDTDETRSVNIDLVNFTLHRQETTAAADVATRTPS